MTKLKLNEEKEEREGFWRRQFQAQATEKQRIFDWLFGVIFPVACFVFDPIVFKGGFNGSAELGHIKPFAYVLSFVSVMWMAAWLVWGARLKWLNGFTAGVFVVGGLISFGIGIVLLPISLLGLIIIVGILGFTPLVTAIVFLRNARRAFGAAKPFLEPKTLIHAFALSAIFSAVVPYVLNVGVKNSLDRMVSGSSDAATIRSEARALKLVAPVVNFDPLVRRYRNVWDEETRTTLAETYRELTGENIQNKAMRFD